MERSQSSISKSEPESQNSDICTHKNETDSDHSLCGDYEVVEAESQGEGEDLFVSETTRTDTVTSGSGGPKENDKNDDEATNTGSTQGNEGNNNKNSDESIDSWKSDAVSLVSTNSSEYSNDHDISIKLKQLIEENTALKNEIQSISTKYPEISTQAQFIKQRLVDQKAKDEESQSTITKLTNEIAALKSKIKELEELNSEVKSSNGAVMQNLVSPHFGDEVRKNDMELLKSANEDMKKELTRVKDQRDTALLKLEDQKQKEIAANQVIATLQSKIESMISSDHTNVIAEKQKEIDALKANMESMSCEMSKIKLEHEALQPKLLELNSTKEQLSQLNDENGDLKTTLEKLNVLNQEKDEQLEAQRQKLESSIQAASTEVALNSDIRNLTEQLKAANKTIHDHKQTEANLLKFSQDQLRFSAEQLEEAKTVLQKQIDELKSRLDEVKTKLMEAETKLISDSEGFQRLASSEEKLTQENQVLKSQIESLQIQLEEKSKELSSKAKISSDFVLLEENGTKAELKENLHVVEEQLISDAEESSRLLKEKEMELVKAKKEYLELEELYNLSRDQTEELKEKLRVAQNNSFITQTGKFAVEDDESSAPFSLLSSEIGKLRQQELKDKVEEIEKLQSQIQVAKDELKTKQDALEEKEKIHQSYVQQLKADSQVEISRLEKLVLEQTDILEAKEHLNLAVLDALGELEKEKEEFEKLKEVLKKKEVELQEASVALKRCQEIVQKYKEKNYELETKLKANMS